MNPEVAKKIQLDDVDSIYHLKQMVDTALKSQKWRNDTKAVAFRLIASSFYFQKDHYSGDEATVQGKS